MSAIVTRGTGEPPMASDLLERGLTPLISGTKVQTQKRC